MTKNFFERELSLLSRAPSSHWLIERARWGPLVSLWSLEGFASNIVRQFFVIWSPSLWDPAGYPDRVPRVGVPSLRIQGVLKPGYPSGGSSGWGSLAELVLYHNYIVMILNHVKTSYSKHRKLMLMD